MPAMEILEEITDVPQERISDHTGEQKVGVLWAARGARDP